MSLANCARCGPASMARASVEERIRSVVLYLEGVKDAREIATVLEISIRTLRRWTAAYRDGGVDTLAPKKPGPETGTNSVPKKLEERILKLKQKHPSWGARRIKNQYDLPCHWRTVHRIIKRHGLLVQGQAEASALEEVPAIPRRLDVAGRHVRVPHSGRREGLRHRIHGRQVALQDKVRSIPPQELEGIDRRSAARPPERKDSRGRCTSTTGSSSSRRSSRGRRRTTDQAHLRQALPSREGGARSRTTTRSCGAS